MPSMEKIEDITAWEEMIDDRTERHPLSSLSYSRLSSIRLEQEIAAETALKVRKVDTFWTLAARNMGVSPNDRDVAGEIAAEAQRLAELNGGRLPEPGGWIATFAWADIKALAGMAPEMRMQVILNSRMIGL